MNGGRAHRRWPLVGPLVLFLATCSPPRHSFELPCTFPSVVRGSETTVIINTLRITHSESSAAASDCNVADRTRKQ
ncbi:hypothetical protein F2P81_003230 [Scophthalmus maximus]|uniref:Secreted protein n=1 Tax=Scophthalmus maximus TaxID=52904 RepID=A0A6A4TPZ2_SCOMX|nr:hypothetical protein F2P81_003230 [Scophthalmus maximus]